MGAFCARHADAVAADAADGGAQLGGGGGAGTASASSSGLGFGNRDRPAPRRESEKRGMR